MFNPRIRARRSRRYDLWRAVLILAILSVPCAASEPLRVPRFDRLSAEDGLSNTSVWAIEQDAQGFLWFGTSLGLNRYDGYSFKVYKNVPEDPGSLSHSDIRALHVDRQGVLWIATAGGGLNAFVREEERFEHYRHDPADPRSLSHDVVNAILEDRSGVLWVGTERGLDRFFEGTITRTPRDPDQPGELSGRKVLTLFEDRTGDLWIGTDAGLGRLDPENGAFSRFVHDPADPASLGHDRVLAIAEDPGGQLWIGTETGLSRLDPGSATFTHFTNESADPRDPTRGRIFSLRVDGRGGLWVATVSGLDRLDSAGAFVHFRHDPSDPQSLSSDLIFDVFEDRTGVVWLGTAVGVSKYVPSRERFATLRRSNREPTLSSNNVAAILEDRSGTLWVGTFDQGLDRIDAERRTVVHYAPDPADPESLHNGAIASLLEDRSGVLWVGTLGGLSRLDGERFAHYEHDPEDPHSLSNDLILSLCEDAAGRLWVGTFEGLNRFERDSPKEEREHFIRYPVHPGDDLDQPGPGRFYAIYEDRSGVVWFGSEPDGLYRFAPGQASKGSERFEHFRHEPGSPDSLSSGQVQTIYEDRSGTLWVGTSDAGLNRLDRDRGRFVRYRERDGLASDGIASIVEDDEDYLWLGTYRGLSRFDPRSETFRNYDVADGLQGNVFSRGSALRTGAGELAFGGRNGLNIFLPGAIAADPQAPAVAITELFLFNEPVAPRRFDATSPLERSVLATRELVLSHRDAVFSFEFAALHYAKPRKNRYAYRLEDFDRDWIETDSTRRFAQYSNLGAGEYVFRVKASNGDGVWNEEGAAIKITVTPPFWGTWWFRAATLVALAAALVALHRSIVVRNQRRERELAEREKAAELEALVARLEEKNTELERFTYTVSHDLKAPLVTIRGFLGFMKKDLATGNAEQLEEDVEHIDDAAQKMSVLVEELLALSRVGHQVHEYQEVPLAGLVREARDLVAGEIAERAVEVEVAPDAPPLVGDRARLVEVFQNLLQNAVKYMGDQSAPRVEVGARRDGEEDVFYVRDNGRGIDPRYHDKIFGLFERLDTQTEGTGVGLALVKRIIEVHGGRIWVESQGTEKGSTFCLTLPKVSSRSSG